MDEKIQQLLQEIIQLRKETSKKIKIYFIVLFTCVFFVFDLFINIALENKEIPDTPIMIHHDSLDCDDFANRDAAQFFLEWCHQAGHGDIHKLLQSHPDLACFDHVYGEDYSFAK